MKSKANFHIHTVHSDGGETVEQIVKQLKEQGITHFAITDHDTVDGVEEGMRLAEQYGMNCVPGVEISAIFLDEVEGLDSTCTAHILALGFDVNEMRKQLEAYKQARQNIVAKLVDQLIEDGFAISKERNYNSRTTVAWELVKSGCADKVGAAFENILNSEKYVDYTKVAECYISNVVKDIKNCGGLCVLAHPFGYTRGGKKRLSEEQVEQYVGHYSNYIDGIEVFYQNYDSTQIAFLDGLADKYGLLKSIGTDYHHSPVDLIKYPKYAARLKKETLCFDVEGVTADETIINIIDGRNA